MSLYEKLKLAKSEEDVKDAYIKALGLKSYSKNLVDIQTKEIWFEAKDGSKNTIYSMFTQLLRYIDDALKKGEYIPPFLCVIDVEKAAIMRSADVVEFLRRTTIKWGKRASDVTSEALATISAYIGTYLVSFKLETNEDEFISTIKNAIAKGEIIRTQITPNNLKSVFDKWVEMIGREINGVEEGDYALLFFADIMHDGTKSTHNELPAELLHKNDEPCFFLNGKLYQLGSKNGYKRFWAIYDRPPKKEYRNYLLERRDSLIPVDERSFKGAYYTPLHVVEKAYEKLNSTLGKNWQKEYIVWDMCCGVGNLEAKHSNPRNIYMSTLDSADIDVMRSAHICVGAQKFQYDFLNDDIKEDGTIDYTLTNKIPAQLQKAISENKKILILINPPYAEAGSTLGKESKGKVAKSKFAEFCMDGYGKSSNELFTQFVARIAQEIPNATIAMFSTLKYVNAPNFEEFRSKWSAKYLDGFIVHSKAFDGLKGNFPIGFLIWKMGARYKTPITEVSTEVLDKNATPIGQKSFHNLPKSSYLNVWFKRPRANSEIVVPLKNTVDVYDKKPSLINWSDNAIGYLWCKASDMQNSGQTVLFSSVWGDGHGFYITPENILQAVVVFAVRRLIKPTWINDRDQFLQPACELSSEFMHDCLVWTLFNGSNLSASADDLEWSEQKWSIVNHFIPYGESEVGSKGRFESDFMVQFLKGKKLSSEAKEVLKEGKVLWSSYFKQDINSTIRAKYKLNRDDVGWYQIRKTLQELNAEGENDFVSFVEFERAYKTLGEKLIPQVYEYGFLKL